MADDIDCYGMEDIPGTPDRIENQYGSIKVIENGYVVSKKYCKNCGSIDIRTSKTGLPYCGKICRKS